MWQIYVLQSHRIYECVIMQIVSDKENKCKKEKNSLKSKQKENSCQHVT